MTRRAREKRRSDDRVRRNEHDVRVAARNRVE